MNTALPPCVVFEDEHLLVVNKPAGVNTHSPSPYAGEGIYEWLRHRDPRWAKLAILHRLDKTTSGVMVFGKTTLANRSLTEQFAGHLVRKKYLLLTDRKVPFDTQTFHTKLLRMGDRYDCVPLTQSGEIAETKFTVTQRLGRLTLIEAEPLTGKTHQIRSHAAFGGFPILGDTLYGGTFAHRVHLHARQLSIKHPVDGREMSLDAAENFEEFMGVQMRRAFIVGTETNAYRLVNGASDGFTSFYLERLGDVLLAESGGAADPREKSEVEFWMKHLGATAAYHKILHRQVRRTVPEAVSPQPLLGKLVPDVFVIRENGVLYEMSFKEGYSVGLFLDQRENRRRLLEGHVAAEFPLFAGGGEGRSLLNTFSYTCGFSVCAAKAGFQTTSLDLSKKYLEWGKRNYVLNGLDPSRHDFIFGDAFDWMKRLAKKERSFDVVILDPPTFSQSKETGRFSAERDYARLVEAALPVLKPGGVLLASTNAARLEPEEFVLQVGAAVVQGGRKVLQQHYVPQPVDFPTHREEPAYLKTLWLRIS